MSLLKIIILSIVQGITELLPVSSSGHLIIVSNLLGINISSDQTYLSFITLLHFATGLALLIVYFNSLISILKDKSRIKIILNLIIASIPAIIAGVILSDYADKYFGSLVAVALELIFWGILMIVTDQLYPKIKQKIDSFKKYGFKESVLVGLAQVLSLFPGTSRSGITTMAGITLGAERKAALDFSFIIGLPIVFGSFFYETYKNRAEIHQILSVNNLIGAVIAFVVALFAVKLLQKIVNTKFLTGFGIYRIILGIVVILTVIIK